MRGMEPFAAAKGVWGIIRELSLDEIRDEADRSPRLLILSNQHDAAERIATALTGRAFPDEVTIRRLDTPSGDTGEFDNGYSFWGGYDFGNGFNVKARIESASFVDGDDVDATELYASYALSENLAVALSLHNTDNGTADFDTNTVEFVATF